jgi:hypothetical protein
MSLHYLIDGYNCIRHKALARSIRDRDFGRGLLRFIEDRRLTGSGKNTLCIVFDGFPSIKNPMIPEVGTKVIFSGDESADDRIKRMVEAGGNPRAMVVVTDDRQIRDYVRSVGAAVMGVEEFVSQADKRRVARGADHDTPLSAEAQNLINRELRKLWLRED